MKRCMVSKHFSTSDPALLVDYNVLVLMTTKRRSGDGVAIKGTNHFALLRIQESIEGLRQWRSQCKIVGGENILYLSDQQYLLWDTASQST